MFQARIATQSGVGSGLPGWHRVAPRTQVGRVTECHEPGWGLCPQQLPQGLSLGGTVALGREAVWSPAQGRGHPEEGGGAVWCDPASSSHSGRGWELAVDGPAS